MNKARSLVAVFVRPGLPVRVGHIGRLDAADVPAFCLTAWRANLISPRISWRENAAHGDHGMESGKADLRNSLGNADQYQGIAV